MNSELFFVIGIPLAAFATSGLIAFGLAKGRFKHGLIALAGLWSAFSVWMVVGMTNATGLDGLGYVAGLIGLSAPAAVGGLIGLAIGRAKVKDGPHDGPTDSTRHLDRKPVTR